MAAYASVDGRTLWLATAAGPGSLGLRDEAGAIVPLRSVVADEQPGYLSACAELDELLTPTSDAATDPTSTATASYDAVVVASGGSAKAVWSHPLPDSADVRPRVSADGTHLWRLARRDDGTLQVVRTPQPPTAWLRAIRLDGDTVTLTIDPVAPNEQLAEQLAGPELRLVDPEGHLVLTRPITAGGDGLLRATISVADLPPGPEVWPRLHVGDLPVRRRDDDLVRAERANTLPAAFGDDLETPAMRFLFTPQGTLGVRLTARDGAVG